MRDMPGQSFLTKGKARTVTHSRIVRYGGRLYRETFVVRYLPNGRVDTRIINRTRIG